MGTTLTSAGAADSTGARGPRGGDGELDAIVVGAGQNGLAAAARLAGAGRKVVVLERRDAIGGLAGGVEIHPGYQVPGILHDEGRVAPRDVARLGLERHGLAFRDAPPVTQPHAHSAFPLLQATPDYRGANYGASEGPR